jgi:hypothetical protein
MIGRYARSLGWKPHAPIVAGAILLILGIWQGAEPLLAEYPDEAELVPVTGSASEVVDLDVQSGGLPIFTNSSVEECRAILDPGSHPVFYRSILPDYDAVCEALSNGATVMMWPTAPDAVDRALAWGVSSADTQIASPRAVIEALRAWRKDRLILAAVLAAAGLALVIFGITRWSRTPREGPAAR